MTIFYWQQHRLRDWAGGSRAPIALFWQMFIKRPRPLARLSISPTGGVLKIIHQAIVTAKMRRLRRELMFRTDSRDQVCPAVSDIDRDVAKFPQRPLILGDKWDF